MNRAIAVLLLVICTALWGFAFVFQKGAMEHMQPLTFAGVRYVLGTLLVLPLAIREYRRQTAKGVVISREQWIRIGILSVAFFLGVWFQQVALITTSVTNGGFITSLYVIFTPIVTYLTIRAKPHPIIYLGAPLALFGIYLLTGADFSSLSIGDLQLLICAVFWGVQVSMLGALVKETGMPIFISTVNFGSVAVLALAGAFALETPELTGISAGWIAILYSGVFSTAVAFTFQAIGQQHVPAANAAIILSAESLFAALGGALILHERLPPLGYLGAAVIFLAIITVELVPALRGQKHEPTLRESG
ncbi:MAG: DMT family transporter [Hyphomicrobiales bacterium]|nr:MAG: DMT family transporter [Hyphomicrobiales bacterium]